MSAPDFNLPLLFTTFWYLLSKMPHFTVPPYSCLSSLLHTNFKSCLSNTVNSETNSGEASINTVLCHSLQEWGRTPFVYHVFHTPSFLLRNLWLPSWVYFFGFHYCCEWIFTAPPPALFGFCLLYFFLIWFLIPALHSQTHKANVLPPWAQIHKHSQAQSQRNWMKMNGNFSN